MLASRRARCAGHSPAGRSAERQTADRHLVLSVLSHLCRALFIRSICEEHEGAGCRHFGSFYRHRQGRRAAVRRGGCNRCRQQPVAAEIPAHHGVPSLAHEPQVWPAGLSIFVRVLTPAAHMSCALVRKAARSAADSNRRLALRACLLMCADVTSPCEHSSIASAARTAA